MSSEITLGLKIHDADNVATLFSDVTENCSVEIVDKRGHKELLQTLRAIPFGHKIAIEDIKEGEQITKYGEEIGVATMDISKGEYVHIHNLDSIRCRGDWD